MPGKSLGAYAKIRTWVVLGKFESSIIPGLSHLAVVEDRLNWSLSDD